MLKVLSEKYPYHSCRGKRSWLGVSSRVSILTQDSIISESGVYFKRAKGSDGLAKKGVLMVNMNHKGNLISIYGTHLQASGGDEGNVIRKIQLKQLSTFISEAPDINEVILAGDFNTRV